MPDGAPITPGSGLGVATDEAVFNLTGTVAKNGTTTVTGSSTVFLSQLSAGQVIRIPGTATEDRIIAAIASDTSLTVTVAFTNTASGQVGQQVTHVQILQPQRAGTPTLTNVAASATSVTIDAANANRLGLMVVNDSASATLLLKYGATASATSFTVALGPSAYWEMPAPIYTGIVDGIWSAAVGSARVTELTA